MTDDLQCSYLGCERTVQKTIKYTDGPTEDFCQPHFEKLKGRFEDDIEAVLNP